MSEQAWYPFNEGQTIGTEGSERGIIIRDEENIQMARITLEQCLYPPFVITCGIYGWMVHTLFSSSKVEALEKLETMKKRLVEICQFIPGHDDLELEVKSKSIAKALEAFVKEF